MTDPVHTPSADALRKALIEIHGMATDSRPVNKSRIAVLCQRALASPAQQTVEVGELVATVFNVHEHLAGQKPYWAPVSDHTASHFTRHYVYTAPQPKPAEQADERIERIAAEWDGCMYDDCIGEAIDIGAAIRRAALTKERTT